MRYTEMARRGSSSGFDEGRKVHLIGTFAFPARLAIVLVSATKGGQSDLCLHPLHDAQFVCTILIIQTSFLQAD